MIDTDKYEGHTEGKWECTDDADGGVELFSSHSKEFHQQWLADASVRHKTQQDKDGMGHRMDDGIITNIAHILHPDDEGIGGGWFHEHNRLVPHEVWRKEQKANMKLIADAPLLLAEVKRLRGLLMKGSEDYTTSYMDLRRIIEDVHWELTGDEHESNEARIKYALIALSEVIG